MIRKYPGKAYHYQCSLCNMIMPKVDYQKHGHVCDSGDINRKTSIEKEIREYKPKEEEMEKAVAVTNKPNGMISTIEDAEARFNQLQAFVKSQMTKEDFDTIPGCKKPCLLKPGAEKLLEIYGYAISNIEITNKIEDWDKGFFHYEIKATAVSKRTSEIVGVGIGSCNSKERKYKTSDGPSIVNTILKMAKKRAVVDLALLVTRSSGLFTQDVEDTENGHLFAPTAITVPTPVVEEHLKDTTIGQANSKYMCGACASGITYKVYKYSMDKHKKALCFNCQKKQK